MPDDFKTPLDPGFQYNKIGTKYTELHKLDCQLLTEHNKNININEDLYSNSYPRTVSNFYPHCNSQLQMADVLISDNNILNERSSKISLMNVRIERTIDVLKSYQKHINEENIHMELDNTQLLHIFDDFVQLLNSHNMALHTISNKVGLCDINKCISFRRHIQARNTNDLRQNILDKLHCFYCHSFDTGYKLT
eukprot:535677_1